MPPCAITLYARIMGQIDYVCPFCHRFQRGQIDPRRPRRRCTHAACHRIVEFGVAGFESFVGTPPETCWVDFERSAGTPANGFGLHLMPVKAAHGQVVGPVEWWCRACGMKQRAKPIRGVGSAHCRVCKTPIFFGLLLRPCRSGAHATTPPDWVAPAATNGGHMATNSGRRPQ